MITYYIQGIKPFWYYWFNCYSVTIDLRSMTGSCDIDTAKFLKLITEE